MLGITDHWAFVVAVLVFLALPGPGTFALLTSTGKVDSGRGCGGDPGLIVGDQVLLWLAVLGGRPCCTHLLPFKALQYAGAAISFTLACA
jgi:threonine/homoserine/homoserine lactone efflux protein